MHCVDVTERLLVGSAEGDPELDRHVAGCARCAHAVRGLERVDGLLASTLVVAPPADLQRHLAQLVLEATQPQVAPWWSRLSSLVADWSAQRPQMVAAQGLAAVMLTLASWQVFGWLGTVHPVLGDVGYAMELVAASPAAVYLGGFQLDLQSLGVWSLVGIGGWLISEDGLIGRRLASIRPRLP